MQAIEARTHELCTDVGFDMMRRLLNTEQEYENRKDTEPPHMSEITHPTRPKTRSAHKIGPLRITDNKFIDTPVTTSPAEDYSGGMLAK